MNDNITAFIDKYANIQNPGYALMLNGGWGCGKTHFVKEWVEKQKTAKKESRNHIVLKPVYVSLFGKKTIDQVVYDIKKEITPWLYGKKAEVCKSVIRCVSQATLHFDINKNGNDDGELTFGFDPLSLLGEDTDSRTIKGRKILVFDDLERCQISIKEILGFINYLVEHNGCKVVVVCDETHIENSEEDVYTQYKEKTIGRVFTVMGDIEKAYDSFVSEVSEISNGFDFNSIKDMALTIYGCSKTTNMRVMRQTIHDFAIANSQVANKYSRKSKLKDFQNLLFTHLLVMHAEGALSKENAFCDYENIAWDLGGDRERRERVNKMLMKYQNTFRDLDIPRLNQMFVCDVLHFHNNGVLPLQFANQFIVGDDQTQLSSAAKIFRHLTLLENDELSKLEGQVATELNTKDFDTISELMTNVLCMSLLYQYKLTDKNKNELIELSKNAIDGFFNKIKGNVPEDFEIRVKYTMSNFSSSDAFQGFWAEMQDDFWKKVQTLSATVNNKMQTYWNEIDDSNVDDVVKIWNETIPDRSSSYGLVPMFKGVDATKVIPRILSLKNASLNHLGGWLEYFYGVSGRNINWQDRLTSDIPFLEQLKDATDKQIANKQKLDRMAYEQFSASLEKILSFLNALVITTTRNKL